MHSQRPVTAIVFSYIWTYSIPSNNFTQIIKFSSVQGRYRALIRKDDSCERTLNIYFVLFIDFILQYNYFNIYILHIGGWHNRVTLRERQMSSEFFCYLSRLIFKWATQNYQPFFMYHHKSQRVDCKSQMCHTFVQRCKWAPQYSPSLCLCVSMIHNKCVITLSIDVSGPRNILPRCVYVFVWFITNVSYLCPEM